MPWHSLSGTGTSRQAWFGLTSPHGSRLSDILLPDGRELRAAVRADGPADHAVWFEQMPETGGSQLVDMLWDTSASGVKVVSDRLAACLTSMDSSARTAPIRVLDRTGATVAGYVAVLEAVGEATPIHSYKRRTRGSKFVVAAEVADRIRAEKFTGLKVTPTRSAFPGDEPL